jgi:hypothetical protein
MLFINSAYRSIGGKATVGDTAIGCGAIVLIVNCTEYTVGSLGTSLFVRTSTPTARVRGASEQKCAPLSIAQINAEPLVATLPC